MEYVFNKRSAIEVEVYSVEHERKKFKLIDKFSVLDKIPPYDATNGDLSKYLAGFVTEVMGEDINPYGEFNYDEDAGMAWFWSLATDLDDYYCDFDIQDTWDLEGKPGEYSADYGVYEILVKIPIRLGGKPTTYMMKDNGLRILTVAEEEDLR